MYALHFFLFRCNSRELTSLNKIVKMCWERNRNEKKSGEKRREQNLLRVASLMFITTRYLWCLECAFTHLLLLHENTILKWSKSACYHSTYILFLIYVTQAQSVHRASSANFHGRTIRMGKLLLLSCFQSSVCECVCESVCVMSKHGLRGSSCDVSQSGKRAPSIFSVRLHIHHQKFIALAEQAAKYYYMR